MDRRDDTAEQSGADREARGGAVVPAAPPLPMPPRDYRVVAADFRASFDGVDLAIMPPLPLAPRQYPPLAGIDAVADVATTVAAKPPLPMPPRLYPRPAAVELLLDVEPAFDPPPPLTPARYGWVKPRLDASDLSPVAIDPPHVEPETGGLLVDLIEAPTPPTIGPATDHRKASTGPALTFEAPRPSSPAPKPGPAATSPQPSKAVTWRDTLRRVAKVAALVAVGYFGVVLLLIFAYRFVDPPMSSLMLQQRLTGHSIDQQWIALEDVSPELIRAVVVSEDGRFCEHSGIDYEAIEDAIERAGDRGVRGASTISMQVVKNLFLWPSKSYLRKAIEAPLTLIMEAVWPKARIMEIYLNIAEWGPGVFGAEAAARHHFGKSATALTRREASRLAVALPNPLLRDAGEPGPQTRRLAMAIQSRMQAAAASQLACVMPARTASRRKTSPPAAGDIDDWSTTIRR